MCFDPITAQLVSERGRQTKWHSDVRVVSATLEMSPLGPMGQRVCIGRGRVGGKF